MKQLTMAQWKATHRDYKLFLPERLRGVPGALTPGRYVLELTDKGTCLVPVKIVKEG